MSDVRQADDRLHAEGFLRPVDEAVHVRGLVPWKLDEIPEEVGRRTAIARRDCPAARETPRTSPPACVCRPPVQWRHLRARDSVRVFDEEPAPDHGGLIPPVRRVPVHRGAKSFDRCSRELPRAVANATSPERVEIGWIEGQACDVRQGGRVAEPANLQDHLTALEPDDVVESLDEELDGDVDADAAGHRGLAMFGRRQRFGHDAAAGDTRHIRIRQPGARLPQRRSRFDASGRPDSSDRDSERDAGADARTVTSSRTSSPRANASAVEPRESSYSDLRYSIRSIFSCVVSLSPRNAVVVVDHIAKGREAAVVVEPALRVGPQSLERRRPVATIR